MSMGFRFVATTLAVLLPILAVTPKTARGAGRQITAGSHAMASTPALPPAEAQRRFTVPPGFEVRLFAAEPQVVNPVAMTWDERGRLWVVELLEYPLKAPPGQKARDRIKILEDTNNDGRADKVTVFAEGLNLATGIARYRGGVLVGQAPDLLFLEDTDGDDVADRRTVLLTGFGLQDTHELLNGFAWGPDGWLYMTQGVFTKSKVRSPDSTGQAVDMNAALARFQPDRKRFEVFADGTSNPWGVDFDRTGQAFVSACVIDHLFHMAPGGVYVRQSGSPSDPYAYELLPSIVGHNHYRAAYAGVQIYQGDQYPTSYRGMIVFGNIHGNSVNRDRLIAEGASFRAEPEPDFLQSSDPWFRPVSELVGPDGNLWISDWYDRYPCHQNATADPEGVDRDYGRIWRVVYVGNKPGARRGSLRVGQKDLARAKTPELVALLGDPNVWHRRTAQRVLSERRDPAARKNLEALVTTGKTLEARLAALWTLHGSGLLAEEALERLSSDPEPAVRAWVARLHGERVAERPPGGDATGTKAALTGLGRLANDPDPTVRAGVAVALRQLASADTHSALHALAAQPDTHTDRLLTFLIWRALEPKVAVDPLPFLGWLRGQTSAVPPLAPELLRRTIRRLYDTGEPKRIQQAIDLLGPFARHDARLVSALIQGLIDGQAGHSARPSARSLRMLGPLYSRPEPEVSEGARRLGAIWGDPVAGRSILRTITSKDPAITDRQRIAAVEVAARMPGSSAQRMLLSSLADRSRPVVTAATIRALGKVGVEGTAPALIKAWRTLPPEARTAAVSVLASRPAWAGRLISAVEKNAIAAADIPLSVRRQLVRIGDKRLRTRIQALLGRERESSAEIRQIISDKKRVMLNGPVDFADGHVQAKQACLLCHKFYGEGGEVGPDLTGVGRATLDALLTNVIDPNQVIGNGYEQVTVTTKDDRTVSGRLVEDAPERVTIVGINLRETIPRSQIASLHVSDVSVMPEGFEQIEDAAFRNLMWYFYQPPQDNTSKLRVELRDKRLVVSHRAPDRKTWIELLTYVTDPELRPYIHPLRDPSGRHVLTDDRPSDHVWQHGVFTGFHKVNGIDFWTEKMGRQRFTGILDLQQETDRVLWKAAADWVAPSGEVLLTEEQAITVHAPASPGADGYTLDIDVTLRTKGEAVTFGQHPYGGLSVRMPLHEKHTHLNANGARHKEADTKRAAWTTVERPFDDGIIRGIAILDHPANMRHPAPWRVDGQGLINPSPSIAGEWSIPQWRSRSFRYRLVVFKGKATSAVISREFESFAAVPFVATGR
jgi:putative membrane-bound dehydrogenase-like protein